MEFVSTKPVEEAKRGDYQVEFLKFKDRGQFTSPSDAHNGAHEDAPGEDEKLITADAAASTATTAKNS